MNYKISIGSDENIRLVHKNTNIDHVIYHGKTIDIDLGYIKNKEMLVVFLFDNGIEIKSDGFSKKKEQCDYKKNHIVIINESGHDIILIDEPIADEYLLKNLGQAFLVFENFNYQAVDDLIIEIQAGSSIKPIHYIALYNQNSFPFEIVISSSLS